MSVIRVTEDVGFLISVRTGPLLVFCHVGGWKMQREGCLVVCLMIEQNTAGRKLETVAVSANNLVTSNRCPLFDKNQ